MKTYVLTVSRTFPTTHKRKGEETFFIDKIDGNIRKNGEIWTKIHTIRSNYELWAKRIKEVQDGKAILSLRYWLAKPYNSKQIEFLVLTGENSVGVQKLEFLPKVFETNPVINEWYGDKETYSFEILAKNDGLLIEDFKEWFKKADFSKPMAIIHFTDFRY